MVPKPQFGSGNGLELNWNRCNRFYPINKPNRSEPTVFWLVPQFRQLRTLASTKYLSSDRITIWYLRKRCSFGCSLTSYSLFCDPINICWVTAKDAQVTPLFHSNSTNIDWISKWRIGGERACKTASFTIYHIVIWSELKYVIGAKVLSSGKWGSAVCRTCPKNRGFMSGVGNNPARTMWVWLLAGSGTDPNRIASPNLDRWRDTRPHC